MRRFVVPGLLLLAGALFFRQVEKRRPPDFTQFYLAGKLAASGEIGKIYHEPAYDPLIAGLGRPLPAYEARYFNRPAFSAFLYAPLALLPYGTASLLGILANFVLAAFLIWKLPLWFPPGGEAVALVRIALALFYPFLWSIVVGQDTLLLTLVVAASIRLSHRGNQIPAGLALAAGAFKPHLIWTLPLAFLAAKRWKTALAFAAGGAVLAAVSLALVGFGGLHEWLSILRLPSTDYDPALMGNLRAAAIHWGVIPAAFLLILTLAAVAVVFRKGSLEGKLCVSVFAALLLSPHTYLQDYSLAAIPALLGSSRVMRWLILAPWWLLYPRSDQLPMILIALASIVLAAAQALGGQPVPQPALDPYRPAQETSR